MLNDRVFFGGLNILKPIVQPFCNFRSCVYSRVCRSFSCSWRPCRQVINEIISSQTSTEGCWPTETHVPESHQQ